MTQLKRYGAEAHSGAVGYWKLSTEFLQAWGVSIVLSFLLPSMNVLQVFFNHSPPIEGDLGCI